MHKEEDDLPAVKAAWESTVRRAQHLPHPFRRRSCIFSSMSVTPTDSDDTSTTPKEDQVSENPKIDEEQENVYQAERLLANGDFYMGQWSGNLPDGPGKYLWTDGCMYEGEWHKGKTTGKGKFSWPSGATYEGEFKSGFMDGFGTYTGSAGDTYRGSWAMNLKNGPGKKYYANGDYYDGEWRAGVQDGHGRYVWRNGNEYIGQWRSGTIHGRGSLIWSNGNRYDGGWEDGLPRGNGSFRWSDGSLYIGFWSRDAQKGVYYPSPLANSPTARDPQVFFAADLGDCKVCPSDTVSVLPSQKSLNWPGMEADFLLKQAVWRSTKVTSDHLPRRQSSLDVVGATDTTPASRRPNGHSNTVIGTGGEFVWQVEGEEFAVAEEGNVDAGGASDGGVGEEEAETRGLGAIQQQVETRGLGTIQQQLQQMKGQAREMRKQGETISKGHKNYDLMLNLQLGIRHAVGKQAQSPVTSLDLRASAFDPKEKVWTKFPPEGSKHTPPHQSCDFKWKDYCPLVFRTLRRLFKVDAGEYMISICGDDALRELSSPGKSGSFFYLTDDDRYMIKTVKKSEVKVLLRMLPAYYNHVRAFENTLVTKFFGLHCVKLTGTAQKKVRFVIMGNLFCSEYVIHRRFDLKGSSHGRTTDKSQAEIDENTTLKDLDLNFIFRLQRSWFQEFCRQVDRDCELLEQERIMDYSLLVGVHFREIASPTDASLIDASFSPDNADVEATPRLSRVDMDQFLCDPTRWATISLGINMPARVEQIIRTECDSLLIGEPTGEFYDVIVFFGIIDILQDYDISKKLEHAYKSIQYDPTSISAVDPKQYAKRFRDFIFRVFTEDT